MRRLLFFLLFVSALVAGWALNRAGHYRDVYRSICNLTEEHFYKDDAKLELWVRACRLRAQAFPLIATDDQLLQDIQDHMNELNVSHFQVYSPVEDRKLWKGEAVDTGIRARYVEDHLVVYRVIAGSTAEERGVKAGDEILSVPGSDQVTPYGAQRRKGIFTFKRAEEILKLELDPKEIAIDGRPQLSNLGRGTALLEISSFRSEYFEKADWSELANALQSYAHVIVDLRENAGGNFVAMLRALSTFHCEGRAIGTLLQPRKALPDKEAFDDNTSDAYQIRELQAYRSLALRTFGEYGCYRGRATVLISSETSSVAEIFAHSFFYRKNSRVWGQPSAGDVILAVWYDLPALGPGYSVSIPEAVYLTPEQKELEGQGVYPQKDLYYDLKQSLAGKDSWIELAR